MEDIRLKKHPFEYGGKAYELSVNMNVLADLQELHDGNLNAVLLKGRTMKTVFEIAAAAMNDYADSKGWPERVTAKELGRTLGMSGFKRLCEPMMDMLIAAIKEPDDSEPEEGKNVKTTETNRTV